MTYPATTGPRLRETAPIVVSLTAARAAAQHWRCGEEEARRRLTALAGEASCQDRQVRPERWRARRRSLGWDIGLAVWRERTADGLEVAIVDLAGEIRRYA